jgi:exonuclease VII small subunit
LSLDGLGGVEDAKKKEKRFKKDAKSFKKILEDSTVAKSLSELNTFIRSLQPGQANLIEGIRRFEKLVKSIDAGNEGFTHAWRDILLDHSQKPSNLKSVVLYLKCPKDMKVGICFRDACADSKTGAFMEPILGAYLSGICHL